MSLRNQAIKEFWTSINPVFEDSPRYLVISFDCAGVIWASRQNYIPVIWESDWLLHQLTKNRWGYYYSAIEWPKQENKAA